MKQTYTLALHVYRLKLMLKHERPCSLCPAGPKFMGHIRLYWKWKDPLCACRICMDFVSTDSCPCVALGAKEAIRITKQRIRRHEHGRFRGKKGKG